MRDSDEDLPIVLSFDFRIFFNSALETLDLRINAIGDESRKVIRDAWQGKDVDLRL